MLIEQEIHELSDDPSHPLHAIVKQTEVPLCITDPKVDDNPMVFVNDAFCDLTGYTRDELIGRNCRLLQGPDTDPHDIERLRLIINSQSVGSVEILNYRKDGTPFYNLLQIGPIMDDARNLRYYFGVQHDKTIERQTEARAASLAQEEVTHRLRNIVNVMSVIIRKSRRDYKDLEAYSEELIGRLEALSAVHFETFGGRTIQSDLHGSLERILSAYALYSEDQFSLSGPRFLVPHHLLSTLTLTIHELAANAIKYGGFNEAERKVSVSWSRIILDNRPLLSLVWKEDGLVEVTRPEKSHGTTIIGELVEAADGRLDFDWRDDGVKVTLSLPLP